MQLLESHAGDGNEPFLPALAKHTDELLFLKDVAQLQVDQFRNTQATREEHLDDSLVALPLPFRQVDGTLQHIHLLHRQIFGQMFPYLRIRQEFGGIILQVIIQHQVTIEGTNSTQHTSLRTSTHPFVVQGCRKLLQVLQLHIQQRHLLGFHKIQ